MRTLAILAAVALATGAEPAAALVLQYSVEYDNGSAGFGIVMLVFALVALIVVCSFIATVMSAPPPREKTAEEYNAESVLLAAKRHHTEMQTDLRMAEIEAARVEAIHKERGEIIAHDKKVRDLSARLDEKRRVS